MRGEGVGDDAQTHAAGYSMRFQGESKPLVEVLARNLRFTAPFELIYCGTADVWYIPGGGFAARF